MATARNNVELGISRATHSRTNQTSGRPAPAVTQRLRDVLAELRGMSGAKERSAMARVGINVENSLGVSIYDLRALAKRIGIDRELALQLWKTETQEARLLACFVDDPTAVTEAQCESWVLDFDSWNVCDQATTSLFDQTKHAWPKAVEWATREEEWVKRAAFALMAGLAVHDKTATDRQFMTLFPLIEQGAFDQRNFVMKAANWALRNIGKRNLSLNQAAVACATRLLATANKRAGGARGGDASVRSARWVATDALRELRSDKTLLRLQAKSKASRPKTANPVRRRTNAAKP